MSIDICDRMRPHAIVAKYKEKEKRKIIKINLK